MTVGEYWRQVLLGASLLTNCMGVIPVCCLKYRQKNERSLKLYSPANIFIDVLPEQSDSFSCITTYSFISAFTVLPVIRCAIMLRYFGVMFSSEA